MRACRRSLRAFYGVPTREAVEGGLRFGTGAERAWKQGGGRLASTLNYALVRPDVRPVPEYVFVAGIAKYTRRVGICT